MFFINNKKLVSLRYIIIYDCLNDYIFLESELKFTLLFNAIIFILCCLHVGVDVIPKWCGLRPQKKLPSKSPILLGLK